MQTKKDQTDLAPGGGKVISENDQKIAVYKDKDGKVTKFSAACTHRGCTVGWNDDDKTWDCPCHGSRFQKDGAVMHGPAEKPLRRI